MSDIGKPPTKKGVHEVVLPPEVQNWADAIRSLLHTHPSFSDIHISNDGAAFLKIFGKERVLVVPDALRRAEVFDSLLVALSLPVGAPVDVDAAGTIAGTRFRAVLIRCIGGHELTLRRLSGAIPKPDEIFIPDSIVDRFCGLSAGLVIVGGATGTGKSTTIASLLADRARRFSQRTVTIEDPIEYVFPPSTNGSHFVQREVNRHTPSFLAALHSALRMAPNIIYVGEVRDCDTAQIAVEASMTGHVVVCTTHGEDVVSTLERFANLLNGGRDGKGAASIAAMSNSLRICLCQRLVFEGTLTGKVVPLHEVLFWNTAISNHIRGRNFVGIKPEMEGGRKQGMQDFEAARRARVADGMLQALA